MRLKTMVSDMVGSQVVGAGDMEDSRGRNQGSIYPRAPAQIRAIPSSCRESGRGDTALRNEGPAEQLNRTMHEDECVRSSPFEALRAKCARDRRAARERPPLAWPAHAYPTCAPCGKPSATGRALQRTSAQTGEPAGAPLVTRWRFRAAIWKNPKGDVHSGGCSPSHFFKYPKKWRHPEVSAANGTHTARKSIKPETPHAWSQWGSGARTNHSKGHRSPAKRDNDHNRATHTQDSNHQAKTPGCPTHEHRRGQICTCAHALCRRTLHNTSRSAEYTATQRRANPASPYDDKPHIAP